MVKSIKDHVLRFLRTTMTCGSSKDVPEYDYGREDHRRCSTSHSSAGDWSGKGEDVSMVRKYNWEDIKKLTENFSVVVGSGGFSTVYLARFSSHRGRKPALGAVKVHCGGERLQQAFREELEILFQLNHDNIVKFLGYCDEREEGALVFEYIPNGTLQDKLHPRSSTSRPQPPLPWQARVAIAYRLAVSLDYLHSQCAVHIVHGDIKPSNILLDDNLNPKLCDFGFAKMGFSSSIVTSNSPNSFSSPRRNRVAMGSPGYTDPNYLRTGIASKKSDVYSFGVVVLELLMGVEAFSADKGHVLMSVFKEFNVGGKEKKSVSGLIDRTLNGEFEEEEAHALVNLARACVHQSLIHRPTANQILQIMREKISWLSFPGEIPGKMKT